MVDLVAQAYPRKHFFVDMFTRDISLIDCLLDLIDNAVDGLVRSKGIGLGESLLVAGEPGSNGSGDTAKIEIEFSEKEFVVQDNCGGIELSEAKEEIFNFGHSYSYYENPRQGQLGVYGVGLKRAIFKVGQEFLMVSKTKTTGFKVDVNLKEWIKKDDSLSDWTFPLEELRGATTGPGGTRIRIRGIREEVRSAIRDPTFEGRLHRSVAHAYAFFLHRFIRISIRGRDVEPIPLPFGESGEVKPAVKRLSEEGVEVYLFGSIASRDAQGRWTADRAGWYVACNGRLIVTADKTALTGWGTGALPEFHSKYRGFIGLVLFQSEDPLQLPWKTTKRGLNEESEVYQRVRAQMNAVARPVLSFLDKMYPTEMTEESTAREVAQNVGTSDVRGLASRVESVFSVTPRKRKARTTVRVQFSAERTEIDLVRHHLRRPDLSAGAVGKYVLDSYLKREGLK